jgi:SOS-response transcriptional repressor LexA
MAAVLPFVSKGIAEFCVLQIALPGLGRIAFGVILLDTVSGRLGCRFRDDLVALGLNAEDQDYCSAIAEDVPLRLRAEGVAFLLQLEDSLSNFLTLSVREQVSFSSFDTALNRLFAEHVDNEVRRFETHIPVYSLRAAATKFGEEMDVEETGWIRVPERLRVSPDLFVAQVTGRSMEPLIPDGSFCIFRRLGAGSRQGKRLLIQQLGAASGEYTIKVYSSRKVQSGEDDWEHVSIRLQPLNPAFEAFDLTPDQFNQNYRAIAEFVQVLLADDAPLR